jgi:hypothetical protein
LHRFLLAALRKTHGTTEERLQNWVSGVTQDFSETRKSCHGPVLSLLLLRPQRWMTFFDISIGQNSCSLFSKADFSSRASKRTTETCPKWIEHD